MLSFCSKHDAKARMNALGAAQEAFFFIISFDQERNLIIPKKDWEDSGIAFSFPTRQYEPNSSFPPLKSDQLKPQLPERTLFDAQFHQIQHHLRRGDTYLLNLTFEVPIFPEGNLSSIYQSAQAPYKIFLPDYFTCFSPECFIKIENGKISTYPMKGTINANVPNAAKQILNDPKETAEHYTIVDLLRNDLSSVGTGTEVQKFRYLSSIHKRDNELLQVSSEITAHLHDDWQQELGTILFRLLPAGSISGAPKEKTVSIIEAVETHSREWYTGVAGWYENNKLDSAVLIRYIGKNSKGYHYKTGGGITLLSDPDKEYQELADKVYIPTA